jgi:beta-xylosidase
MKWKNPVYPGYFADPFVWKYQGKYYAVGTGPISEQREADEADFSATRIEGRQMAIPLLVSDDLTHWNLQGGALEVPEFAIGAVFWAPEVAFENNLFYLYYSFATHGLNHQLRVASSEQPAGPYHDAGPLLPETDHCPFAIDASPFRDDDGQWFLFYARDFLDHPGQVRAGTGLVVDRLLNMTRLAGETKTVLRAKHDWQRFKANRLMYGRLYDWHTLEGPCVVKHRGQYFCTFSGGCYEGEGYGVDYAVASQVLGPYSDAGNENGARILRTVPGKVIGPGHHSIVKGPDDRTEFLVYHAWDPAMTGRRMHIDLLEWTPDGPRCNGPTWTEQRLPV